MTDASPDTPDTPDTPGIPGSPRPRKRRTVLVTSRWAASAAVIAAMTTGALDVNDDHPGSETSSSVDAGGDLGGDSTSDGGGAEAD